MCVFFFFQAEDGIRDLVRSRGLGDVYKRQGLVRGFRRLATHDSRTCPACLALEGEFYDVSSPLRTHPQCRCAMIPVVKGYRELSFQYGEPWLRSQPEATQRAILGKGGYEAWRHGVPLSLYLIHISEPTRPY